MSFLRPGVFKQHKTQNLELFFCSVFFDWEPLVELELLFFMILFYIGIHVVKLPTKARLLHELCATDLHQHKNKKLIDSFDACSIGVTYEILEEKH